MLYGANVAICSQINTKQIHCGENVRFLNVKCVTYKVNESNVLCTECLMYILNGDNSEAESVEEKV
jgi:hypothetical protein